ncbi:MAG: hypothetical protein M1820_000171 [Bogoriella megaspora]|nr:MAG: hypothetical protein M1820_000171 [Bogoriella megaspora]
MSSSSSSSLSSLSPPPLTDDEEQMDLDTELAAPQSSNGTSEEAPSSPKRKRAASPPHEYVLADNQNIAFIVAFRARFSSCFSSKLQDFGPQDIERGVVDTAPGPQVEELLCALLTLLLNRKKNVERGHHGRALEEALSTNKFQWPRSWKGLNPLPGSKTFADLNPAQRLEMLKTLIIWSLNTSEAVSTLIKDSYKHRKGNDDSAVPLTVQPWGKDGDKRQYWLIEGERDTSFRVYRESNPALKHNTWWSVAGDIDELRSLTEKFEANDSQSARRLGTRFKSSIARFEAGEEKRKRREYRQQRKAQFSRPEPGFSLYEGRTRGKRLKYTFSDDEVDESDATSTRRSTRVTTPADPSKPTVTASGRQVRSRFGGVYGESLVSGSNSLRGGEYEGSETSDVAPRNAGRATRSGGAQQTNGRPKVQKHIAGYNELDEMDDEEDATTSGGEWDGGDEDDDIIDRLDDRDEDEEASDDEDEGELEPRSLLVKLPYRKPPAVPTGQTNGQAGPASSILNGTSSGGIRNGYATALESNNIDSDEDTVYVQPASTKPAPAIADSTITGVPASTAVEPNSSSTTQTASAPPLEVSTAHTKQFSATPAPASPAKPTHTIPGVTPPGSMASINAAPASQPGPLQSVSNSTDQQNTSGLNPAAIADPSSYPPVPQPQPPPTSPSQQP